MVSVGGEGEGEGEEEGETEAEKVTGAILESKKLEFLLCSMKIQGER